MHGGGGVSTPVSLDEYRFRRLVEKVHAMGPRVLAEYLMELSRHYSLATPIEAMLQRYATLSPETVRKLGGGDWPA